MPNFMILATAWGPKHGGINAFNMDFAIGLANYLGENAKVFCAVFSASREDVANAREKRVYLVPIIRRIDSSAYDASWAYDVWKAFKQNHPDEKIDWWVGHDVTTGWAAVEGPTVTGSGQSALIMHMTYADYQNYKGGVGERAYEKENQQRQLFKKGSRHFANGPLLRDALIEFVGPRVTMLIPGFANVPVQPSSHRLHLITFGRMDRESKRIKQGALAVAGFASAVKQAWSMPVLPEKLRDNPQMRVIGISETGGDEELALIQLAAEKAGRELNVMALPFDENRQELFEELGRANIALMPSWHEGFGLTGWEAIAGEVPLIVSRQTGLWQLLKEALGEPLAGGYVKVIDVRGRRGDDETANFLPEDEVEVQNAIVNSIANLPMARTYAKKLKQELKKELICTWEHTARQFCNGLGIELTRPAIVAQPDTSKPAILPVQRSEFVAIPKLDWPRELSDKGFEMPDSMLLRPESRVVRFHAFREPLRDTIIDWALNGDAPIKLRLQAGEGGAGKTRLLIEICYRLELRHGWRAGFVSSSQYIVDDFPKLLAEGKPCLLVLDYAESRTSEIVELTRTALHSANIPSVRFVLLAREGGDWWDRLADACSNDQAVSAILRGLKTKTGPYRMAQESIEQKDRVVIFNQALEDFSAFKQIELPGTTSPDLSSDLFKNPLFVHLAALGSLRDKGTFDDKELLGMALGHERSYWRKLLKEASLPEKLVPVLEQAVALLTLCSSKRTAREAKTLIHRAPRLKELDPAVRTQIFDILRRIYPHSLEGGLHGLQPDLLGETLIAEALAKDPELLDAVFGEEYTHTDGRYALTVLTRLGYRAETEQRWLRIALERYLLKVSEDAMHVGIETGSPMPEMLAQAVNAAEPRVRRRAVDLLRVKLPDETLNLTSLSVEIKRQEIAFLKHKTTGKSINRSTSLFEVFFSLSVVLNETGRFIEAADSAVEAVRYSEMAFKSDSESDRSNLALALSNGARHLRSVGRFSEALENAQKAEFIRRRLAEKKPDIYTRQLSISLTNLAAYLGDFGRLEEALKKAEEAEIILRRLAEKQSSNYAEMWGESLIQLSRRLDALGRFEEALEQAEKAEIALHTLREKQPDYDSARWATSLVNLSDRLETVGRFEEALQMAKKAEATRRDLAEKQPDRFTYDWAASISTLSNQLNATGRLDEALSMAEKAEAIVRRLAEKQPDAFTKSWADALNNLGNSLGGVGRFEEAHEMAERSETILRKLAEGQPDVYTAAWAEALGNLGVSLKDVGRVDEALEKAEQIEIIQAKQAKKQPDAYFGNWASSLANLADTQLLAKKPAISLKTAEKAILLITPLAEKYPSLYRRWLGFTHNISAASYFAIGQFDKALTEAERSTGIWAEIAIARHNFESAQVAKAFLTLMRCDIALGRGEVVEILSRTFELLKKPLNDNPMPLRPVMVEMIKMAMSTDPISVGRIVPEELLNIVRTNS